MCIVQNCWPCPYFSLVSPAISSPELELVLYHEFTWMGMEARLDSTANITHLYTCKAG